MSSGSIVVVVAAAVGAVFAVLALLAPVVVACAHLCWGQWLCLGFVPSYWFTWGGSQNCGSEYCRLEGRGHAAMEVYMVIV